METDGDLRELFKLRERVIRLELALRTLGRAQSAQSRQLQAVADRLEGMSKAEELAAAVTDAIRAERHRPITLLQKIAGAILALVLAVPAAHDLANWF